MTDYSIVVGIDATPAAQGEARVVRSLAGIKKAAQETQDQLGKMAGRMFSAADVLRAQRGVQNFLDVQKRAFDATRSSAQTYYNALLDVGRGTKSAADSAAVFERALARQDQAARRSAESFRALQAQQRATMSGNLDRLFGNVSSTGQQQRNIDFYTRQAAAAERAGQQLARTNATLAASFSAVERLALRTSVVLQGLTAAFGFREILQANIEYQKIEFTLRAVTGSSTAAAQELEFVRRAADQLGADLQTAATGYAKLLAATLNTNFSQRETRNLFLAVSEASRAFGLTIADTEGVFRAFQQILSKGTLSAEEIRQQLGDRLPGAFQIFAQAAGMSEQALTKALEAGSITGQKLFDVVNQVAAIMRERAAPAMAEASKGMQAELNRLNTAWFEAAKAVGEGGFNKAVGEAAKGLRQFLDGMRESGELAAFGSGLLILSRNLDLLALAAIAFGARALQPLLLAAGVAAKQFWGLTAATVSFTSAANAAATASLLLGRAWAVLAANPVVAIVTGLATAYVLLSGNTEEATKKNDDYKAALERVKTITEQLAGASGDRAKALRIERAALISNAEAEVRASEAKIAAMNAEATMADPNATMGAGIAQFSPRMQAAQKAFEAAEKALQRLKNAAMDSGEAWEAAFGDRQGAARHLRETREAAEGVATRVDKAAAAQKRYNEDLKKLQDARKVGVITEERYLKLKGMLQKELDDATKGTVRQTAAQKDLNSQLNDAVSEAEAASKAMSAFFDKAEEADLGPAAKLLADYFNKLDALSNAYNRVQDGLERARPGTIQHIRLTRLMADITEKLGMAESRREEVIARARGMVEQQVIDLEREAEAMAQGERSLRAFNEQKQLAALYSEVHGKALQVEAFGLEKNTEAYIEAEKRAKALADRAVEAQRKINQGAELSRNAQTMERTMERSFDRIVDFGADALDELFSTGRIDDFGKNLVEVLRKSFAQLLAEEFMRPWAKQLAAWISSAFDGVGGKPPVPAGGQGGGQAPGGAPGQPTRGAGIGFDNFGAWQNLVGIGLSAVPGILNRNGGQAIMGVAGAAIGTLFGQTALGGILGNIAGSLLFKKKPSVGPGQAVDFLTFPDGTIEARSFAQDNGGSIRTAQQYGRETIRGLDDLFEELGGARFVSGTTFGVGSNQKDRFGFSLFAPGGASVATAKGYETLGDTLTNLVIEGFRNGLIEGLGPNFKKAFEAVAPATAEELSDILERVKAYEEAIKAPLDALDPQGSGLAQALKASADAFDALKKSAAELGLALDPLDEAAARAAQTIRDDFVKTLQGQARDASGQGFINSLLEAVDVANANTLSNIAGFAGDPAALMNNQDLINTIFAGGVEGVLSQLDASQLEQVIVYFGAATDATGQYITTMADHFLDVAEASQAAADAAAAQTAALERTDALRRGGIAIQQALDPDYAVSGLDVLLNAGLTQEVASGLSMLAGAIDALSDTPDNADALTAAYGLLSGALSDGGINVAQFNDILGVLTGTFELVTDAAEEANDALAEATRNLALDFEARLGGDPLATQLRGAMGLEAGASLGAVQPILDLLKQIETATTRGTVEGLTGQIQALIPGLGLTAEQMSAIGGVIFGVVDPALERFNETITETGNAVSDAAEQINKALRRDLIQLQGGDNLDTALKLFDYDAAEKRAEAVAAGADLALFDEVYGLKRQAIIEEWNQKALEEQRRAAEAALREQERAAEEQRRLQEEAARAAEEAAQKIADAMKRAADLNDSLEVRLLRAQGLDHEADILDKIKSNAREWKDALEIIDQGGKVDMELLAKVLNLELSNVVNGTNAGVSGQRGFGYDPVNYDRFFTVAASAYLQNANENFRDSDLLRDQRVVDIASSNVLLPGIDASGTPGNTNPLSLDDVRPFASITVGEFKDIFLPLEDISDNTSGLPALVEQFQGMQEMVAEQRETNEHLKAIRDAAGKLVVFSGAASRDRRRPQPSAPQPFSRTGFNVRVAS